MTDEILFDEIATRDSDSISIIDIRDEDSYEYGHIPGAITIPFDKLDEEIPNLSHDKEFFVYCRSGMISPEAVDKLKNAGFNAKNIKYGYFGYLREHVSDLIEGERGKQVEESLRKKFKKQIFSKFAKAINEYELLSPGDKVAVCISGGKDSMLMAKLFQELKRHNKFDFELVFLVMDPGYSKENREIIERNAQMLNIPITIFETDIFDSVFNIEKSPCYLCARMRRGHLYNKARELGCNKIALGHHYDDVIETILMGMLYGAQVQTMMPKLHSTNFEGMELIRPMYLIREKDIKAWRDYNKLSFIQCACKFTANCSGESCKLDNTGSKRKKVKNLIAKLASEDPQIEGNIFRSVENVNLSTIIAYKDKEGNEHNFKDEY
ncbi:MAG: ATPase [Clostridia bacterium]|nr:ATPase [Clostridia bacterium]